MIYATGDRTQAINRRWKTVVVYSLTPCETSRRIFAPVVAIDPKPTGFSPPTMYAMCYQLE
ncbi:MAG: hypothetical protein R3C61_17280 [Bacteroidia bacterium]